MASVSGPSVSGKLTFPGPIGAKRRRMRSGGNASTVTNNSPGITDGSESEPKTSGKCKGGTTIPIFLKSKYHVATKKYDCIPAKYASLAVLSMQRM
jgi:hypothetical protein